MFSVISFRQHKSALEAHHAINWSSGPFMHWQYNVHNTAQTDFPYLWNTPHIQKYPNEPQKWNSSLMDISYLIL